VEIYDYSDILHMHCRSCYEMVCREQENCVMVRCLYCEVALHSCKIDDHETICLMMQVPCLNAAYGCSVRVLRSEMAKHLETCPANVVHCGMEWNRYPLYSKDRYTITNIYNSQEGRIKQKREHWVPFSQINPPKIRGQLDTEFAISDQRKLLKEYQKKMAVGKWKLSRRPQASRIPRDQIEKLENLTGPKLCGAESSSRGEDIVESSLDLLPIGNLNIEDSNTELVQENQGIYDKKQYVLRCDSPSRSEAILRSFKKECFERDTQKSSHVDNDEKCTDDLDELEVVISSKEHERGIEFQEERSCCTVKPQLNKPDIESDAACMEERELLYKIQVQQEDFHTEKEAVLMRNPTIGAPQIPAHFHEQIKGTATDQLGLNVIIETIPKFQKSHPMYSIPCKVDLRRDQYCSHFKNIHNDIHGGLNYWIQQHCPLAQYGCPFIRRRLCPNSKTGCIVFDHEIDNFGIVPSNGLEKTSYGSNQGYGFDILSLPLELVEKITLFLDSYSINQFSKVCRTTHEICRTLLQRRGIVVFEWERGCYSDGSVLWRVRRKKWLFSPAFSLVSNWHFTDEPSMGEHLRSCPFFSRFPQKHRIQLPIADFNTLKLNSKWR